MVRIVFEYRISMCSTYTVHCTCTSAVYTCSYISILESEVHRRDYEEFRFWTSEDALQRIYVYLSFTAKLSNC